MRQRVWVRLDVLQHDLQTQRRAAGRRLAEAVDTLEKRPTVPTFIPLGTFPSPQGGMKIHNTSGTLEEAARIVSAMSPEKRKAFYDELFKYEPSRPYVGSASAQSSTFLPQPIDPWAKVPFKEPLYPILTGTNCAVNQADGGDGDGIPF